MFNEIATLETAHANHMFGEKKLYPIEYENWENENRPIFSHISFEVILESWKNLAILLNDLNTSMGHDDAYPFLVTDRVAEKLSFIHRLIREVSGSAS